MNFVVYTYAYFVQKLCAVDNMSGVVVIFVLTIEHMVCPCSKYEHYRKQYFPNSQLSRMLLHCPIHIIFNYLTDKTDLTVS